MEQVVGEYVGCLYNIYWWMQRKVSPSLLQRQGFNIKSSFISQYSPEHREKTTQLTSRKQLSSSTFLEQSRPTFAATRKPTRKDPEYPHANSPQQLIRARSAKNNEEGKFKSLQVIEEPQLGVLGESTQRLRTEELLFKLKVRFGSLLKEASASEEEVTKFGQLTKVDELILFVTERLRRALSEASSQASNSTSSNNKDREALENVRAQLEQTKSKLQQREANEKSLKGRLKEAHTELKQLYDKVNVKEKEYSQRTTELYQLRVQMKQQEKAADAMRSRLQAVEKERNQLKSLMDAAGKDHSGMLYSLKQENEQLQAETAQLKEEVARAKERCTKLQELNEHLNEQLTRWRERVQFEGDPESQREREKSSEGAPHTPNDLTGASLNQLKKSTMSMHSAYISKFNNSVRVQSLTALEIDNTRLRLQLAELQKENEHLQRTLLNYAPLKLKYQQALQGVQADISWGLDPKKLEYLKERSGELLRVELQGHFRRRTEQIAREWKQKLYEVICKYEDELQLLKNNIQTLKHERQLAEKKICTLANEKYLIETRLIQVEKDLYTFNHHRSSKSLLSLAHQEELYSLERQSQGRSSEEVIMSNPHLLPIQEEESPNKFRDDPADNISVFSIREEEVCLHPEHGSQ